jgi:hypothetical protein
MGNERAYHLADMGEGIPMDRSDFINAVKYVNREEEADVTPTL